MPRLMVEESLMGRFFGQTRYKEITAEHTVLVDEWLTTKAMMNEAIATKARDVKKARGMFDACSKKLQELTQGMYNAGIFHYMPDQDEHWKWEELSVERGAHVSR